jgi:hypothetical protein
MEEEKETEKLPFFLRENEKEKRKLSFLCHVRKSLSATLENGNFLFFFFFLKSNNINNMKK